MAKARAHIVISGRVQGVSFRYYTMQEAQTLNIVGWVRNLWDGRVEAVFEGEQEAVDRMLAWSRHGPPSAQVEEVKVTPGEPTGEFESFRIRINADVRD
jgi:acylphosphatase